MKTILILTALLTMQILTGSIALADDSEDLTLEKKLSTEYLTKMASEKDAVVIEQGIVMRPIYQSGSQQFAKATDTVQVLYHLADREGKVIDESITADEAFAFPLQMLIKCWQIAVPQMAIGSHYKISCPSDVAYGDKGIKEDDVYIIKPGAALTFRLTVFAAISTPASAQ